MAEYTITFARSARKELEYLPAEQVIRLIQRIESLAETPRPARCRKLVGQEHLWRIRIGDYRVVYAIDDSACSVDIVAVRHRSQAYRW